MKSIVGATDAVLVDIIVIGAALADGSRSLHLARSRPRSASARLWV